MLGTYALSAGYYDAYYGQAQKVRTLIKRDFEQVFAQVDAMACPVAPTTAFPIGAHGDDPLAMYLEDVFTLPANLAGVPGLSFPVGFDAEGLPVGMQLMGQPFPRGYAVPDGACLPAGDGLAQAKTEPLRAMHVIAPTRRQR